MANAFDTFTLKDITLKNRIVVPPMCQYQAVDGMPNQWHEVHYPSLARGGAGLVIVEATAVSPEGRITPACLGLWNDAQAEALAGIAASIRRSGAVPGIQIGHAGRKASAHVPWQGDDHMAEDDPEAWETISPSAIPFGANLPRVPRAMTPADIRRVQADFVAAARRALGAGFEWLELHFAHGYLGQSFLSVHANKRTDEYGGDLAGRGRFLRETVAAVREVWPERLPLTARLGVIEFDGRDEATLADAVSLTRDFRSLGLDLLDVSLGFSTPDANIPWGPALLAPYAQRIRNEAGIPVSSAWNIDTPELVRDVLAREQMDLVMLGHRHLVNPHYPYELARALGVENPARTTLPPSYAHWLDRYRASDER
ncbi:NADH:flavin oxidoreductase/NADH oxidase [Pseudodesulfovibrio mercurii]|uniref:NADH:flavin oxidoreductase/NADH oxidase n=1 Tax=Pseudodesulfovibrio mercurii TaxID=641491 RepID=F0JCQ2_9BACT|nr:NADH:flavin oxidoreductase/NADH oxidase [Pseudodesulfovibrio mercurii]EGB15732.1 NADH:flavin oxidoreductase/NADH oxidase [Pseudodesulfovibrio mercurii]